MLKAVYEIVMLSKQLELKMDMITNDLFATISDEMLKAKLYACWFERRNREYFRFPILIKERIGQEIFSNIPC